MKNCLGLVTIGQTPRPDLETAFRRHAPRADIRLVGALDGVPGEQIRQMTRRPAVYPLHTRLADGTVVDIPIAALAPLVEAKAHSLAREGAQLVVVLCAGHFPEIPCSVPVLLPGKLLPAVVRSVSRTRRLGIVVPNAGQISAAEVKWTSDGFTTRVTSASPFRPEEIEPAARALADSSLEMIVLDCMGHHAGYRAEFVRRTGRPVVLAQSLVSRVVGELVSAEDD